MATYKKKPKTPRDTNQEVHKVEDDSTTAEIFNTLDESASKSEEWVLKNQKIIFGVIGIVVLVTLGTLGFNKFVKGPKEVEAANELAYPKKYFNDAITAVSEVKDSMYTLALEGADGKYGFVDIIENYGSTKAANLANYYAGISYLNLKQYPEAIDYLEAFSSEDEFLGPIAEGAIGDAFANISQSDEALSHYEKAAQAKTNEFTTPLFLFKAGNTALDLNQSDKALGYFERIKNEFPTSEEAKNIDIYISKAKYAAN